MGKTWTRIDPNMGLTPIPYMSGLIYLTPSLYGTLLVYYSVSNLTYLTSFVPIKCIKEVVCQLRPCYMVLQYYSSLFYVLVSLYKYSTVLYNLQAPPRNRKRKRARE